MGGAPVLALAGPRRPEALVRLTVALSRWCRPATLGAEPSPPAAVLATRPGLPVPPGLPVAVWVETAEELASARAEPVTVVLLGTAAATAAAHSGVTEREQGAERAEGARGPVRLELVVALARPVPGAAFVPPAVRSRLRRARGLGEAPVVEHRDGGWFWPGRAGHLPERLVATGVACAAAACVDEPAALLTGFAFGTPVVANPAAASALAAAPGRDVLTVAEPARRRERAQELVRDTAACARISWNAWRHYQASCDLDRTAAVVASRVLAPGGSAGAGMRHVQLRLAELGTPVTATVRSRTARALAALAGRPVGER